MLNKEKLIKNFELKKQQLINENNLNYQSGDLSSAALNSYCENQAQIDRLNYCIKKLKGK